MVKTYEWLHKEKSRFYKITIENNGFRNINLNFLWGGINNNRGGKKSLYVQTYEEAQTFIIQMMKRRKSRGYELIAPVMN